MPEFNLVFKGEIANGHDIFITKQKFSKVFKASDEQIASLFSGRPAVIKKGLTHENGLKLQQQMLAMGAITLLENINMPESIPTSAAKRTRIPPVTPLVQPSKVALVLQPLHEPSPSTENDTESLPDDELTKSTFSLPHINFSLRAFTAIFLFLLGTACLIIFSPYPDHVVRKGFAIGGLFIFMAYRKIKH